MACINPDGTMTPTAKAVLQAAQMPVTVAELARVTGLPLYRVRSSLRELVEAGLLAESQETYHLTEVGRARL